MPIELNLQPSSASQSFAAVVQPQELSETDAKTYAVVILSYLLITIGIALAGASLYVATIVHPMIAMASPAVPIFLGVLGLSSRNPAESVFSAPMTAWEEDQPLGLNNEGSVNCWLNASCQLFFNLPSYSNTLRKVEREFENGGKSRDAVKAFTSLAPFIQAERRYAQEKEKATQHRQSSVSTQSLREWLYDNTSAALKRQLSAHGRLSEGEMKDMLPITERAATRQEDAWEAFKFFLENSGHTLPVVEQVTFRNEPGHADHGRSVTRLGVEQQSLACFAFELDKYRNRSSLSLDDLLQNDFFKETNTTGTGRGTNTITRRLESLPDDFTVYLNRTTYNYVNGVADYKRPIKSSKIVHFPLEFESDKKQFGGEALYECDGFVVHLGSGANSGHYVSYMKRADGKWYYTSDSIIQNVSEARAKEALQSAYIVHYAKANRAVAA